jgi:hypothetical protein
MTWSFEYQIACRAIATAIAESEHRNLQIACATDTALDNRHCFHEPVERKLWRCRPACIPIRAFTHNISHTTDASGRALSP